MQQKQKLQLSALELSDRMRTYRTRQPHRVIPRSGATHLRRRIGMDVWEPSNMALDTSEHKALQSTRPDTTTKQTNTTANSFKKPTPLLNDSKLNVKDSNIVSEGSNLKAFDFQESASCWKKSQQNKKTLSFRRLKSISPNYFMYGMAVVVFMVGITVAIRSFMLDNKIAQTVSAQASNSEATSDVDEKKPSDDDVRTYSVAPDLPRIVAIPKLGINGRVRQMSVDKNGSLEAPRSIHDAGWYNQSAKPGTPGGAVLLDGHVSGPTQKGVFYKIETLNKGDIVTIERGDGKKIDYKVVKVEIKKATNLDMTEMILPITKGTHGLNLISCTGKFNASNKTFEDRALVFTEVSRIY
ncbi:class F sortase [Candidatus Saccharibacteria bacterium]|nr:class F sortase [Candidatus Saccharibacteria bacterium]